MINYTTMATTPTTDADAEHRLNLLEKRFGREYNITPCKDNPSSYFLKPKSNPSVLQATIFPLFKTRYKFRVTFDVDGGTVSFEDEYAMTFNRANGASPEQQERIRRRTSEFGDEVDRLREEIRYNNNNKEKKGNGD